MLKKISARHFDLTAEIRSKAEAELDRLTKFFDNIISAELVLDAEKHRRLAELKVSVFNNTIAGSGETDDIYTAIEVAVDKVVKQLKKYKGKLKEKKPEQIAETVDRLTKPTTGADDFES
jgi:putative sigma-54 modulation protein